MREALLTICTGIIRWPSRTFGGLTSGTGGDFNSSQSEPLFLSAGGLPVTRLSSSSLLLDVGCGFC